MDWRTGASTKTGCILQDTIDADSDEEGEEEDSDVEVDDIVD